MTHVITEPCIGTKDTACVVVCPVDCIHPAKNEADFDKVDQLFIDPDSCIDCGACVSECPVSAIYPLEDVPGEYEAYIEKNAAHFKG
ncbi:4Fe-4S dicluster domain-containing protein [Mesoterricola silvestris]|uniref:Ferredoxin n=1 Tax=Mesoterricola silvestris TaxID=2927979 RepID=A0AA48GMP9_9BACT|nr:4Fe-4S binding protein [Mesoterricola silvestris]BDU74247.1 ferredoxin [Mesoterricola silvestris]